MFIGIRSALYGSSVLLIEDGDVNKIGTKFGYTSCHPSGRAASGNHSAVADRTRIKLIHTSETFLELIMEIKLAFSK